jgi:RNA polymerase sigma factor (sigma-70 family)
MISVTAQSDVELVGESLSGNRDAFGQIVARYQSLVCSLAYSATGSLSQSEDVAQETFLTAWKQLAGLREPEKLRAWLCGIARNLINNSLRKQGREPSHRAESLEEISETHSLEPLPVDQTISNEEQAILWRSLERIPEIYREPLVLFYREHQSIEAVAQNLELTEDAVKQRLSRGRKLLHEEVLAFVEGALKKTSPGKTFTLGVLAALPMVATSTKAATIGAAIAKGGAAAKTAVTFWSLGGIFIFLGSVYLNLRAQADDTKSPRERRFMLQMIGIRIVVTVFAFLIFLGAFFVTKKFTANQLVSDIVFATSVFFSAILIVVFLEYTSRCQRRIQIEEGTCVEAEWNVPRKDVEPGFHLSGNQSKLKNYVRSLRFKAFILMLVAMALMQKLWNLHLKEAVPLLVVWFLCIFLDFTNWKNSPRYAYPFRGTNSSMAIVFISGLITLLVANQTQYLARTLDLLHSGTNVSNATSQTALIIFNLVVILTYAAFIGILVWKHKAALRSIPPK